MIIIKLKNKNLRNFILLKYFIPYPNNESK